MKEQLSRFGWYKGGRKIMIEIPDIELQKGLESVINSWNLRIRPLDKKTLSSIRFLNLNSRNIQDLQGLELCEKIEALYLSDNQLKDISILTKLTRLRILDLSMNPTIKWRSLSNPFYTVEELFLRSCELKNDMILELFPNVRQVSLFHNNIRHLEILYSLPNLESVDLSHNPIPLIEREIFHNQTGVGVMEKKFQ